MAESKLRTLSVDFAVQILNLVKALKSQHETIVSNQIGRAGTSIGANIHEAKYGPRQSGFYCKTANRERCKKQGSFCKCLIISKVLFLYRTCAWGKI